MAKKFLYIYIISLILLVATIFVCSYITEYHLSLQIQENLIHSTHTLSAETHEHINYVKDDLLMVNTYRELDQYFRYKMFNQPNRADEALMGLHENLVALIRTKPTYHSITLLDPQGNSFLQVTKGRRVYKAHNEKDKPWWPVITSMDANASLVSDIIYKGPKNTPFLTVSHPIYFQDKLEAVATIDLSIPVFFRDMIDNLSINSPRSIYLINHQGQSLISNTHKSRDFSKILSQHASMSQDPGIHLSMNKKDNQIISLTFLSSSAGNLGLAMDIPYDRVYEPVIYMNSVLLPIATLIFILIGCLGYFLIKRITRPIEELSDKIQAVSQGDYHVELFSNTHDEIEQLTHNFNTMTRTMLQNQSAVERMTNELQRSNIELDQFASAVSHDLQEPLRKIKFFSKSVLGERDSVLSIETREFMYRISQAAGRAQNLITGLLEYSRINYVRQSLEEVNLNQLIDEILFDLDITLKNVQAQVTVSPLPKMKADEILLRQLFTNLINNSIKFKKKEGPLHLIIWHETTNSDESSMISPANDFKIFIEDNGIGFDVKYSEYIFKPFKRLHRKEEYEGSGLGLAMCHKIVTSHQGSIRAQSILGEGTTFEITLPHLN